MDVSTSDSGKNQEDDHDPISQFRAELELDIKPNTGGEDEKVGLLLGVRLTFDQYYPYRAPKFQITNKKGLDEEQFVEIHELFVQK